MQALSFQAKQGIAEQWLSLTLDTYQEHTARFLLCEKDPFRNPVGCALKEGLPILLDELLGGMNAASLAPALEGIIRIRAVQDFTPSQAVGFLFLLKGILRRESKALPEALAALEDRIDELALLGFDLFMKCRERIYQVKADEGRRKVDLLERMQAGTLQR